MKEARTLDDFLIREATCGGGGGKKDSLKKDGVRGKRSLEKTILLDGLSSQEEKLRFARGRSGDHGGRRSPTDL